MRARLLALVLALLLALVAVSAAAEAPSKAALSPAEAPAPAKKAPAKKKAAPHAATPAPKLKAPSSSAAAAASAAAARSPDDVDAIDTVADKEAVKEAAADVPPSSAADAAADATETVAAAKAAAEDAPAAGNLAPPVEEDEEEADAAEQAVVDAEPVPAAALSPSPSPPIDATSATEAAPRGGAPTAFAPPTGLGDPVAFLPLTEGSGDKVASYPGGEVTGKFNTSTVRWVPDPLFGSALTCSRDAKDLVILDPIEYGTKGPFSVNIWIKPDPADTTGDTFGYPFSHSSLATPQAPSPTDPFHSPGVHILVPDAAHPARGRVRAVVHDTDDPDGQAFLDSDGRYNDNAKRAVPQGAPDLMDGGWHAVTLTSRPDRSDGYVLYVDGVQAATMPPERGAMPPNATLIVGGGSPLGVGRGAIFLCGRSDGAADRHFSGAVSHLAAWDRALSPDEVEAVVAGVPVAAVTGKGVPLGEGAAAGGVPAGGAAAAAPAPLAPAAAPAAAPAKAALAPFDAPGAKPSAFAAASAAVPADGTAAPGAAPSPTTLTVDGTPCAFPFAFGGGLRYTCVTADGTDVPSPPVDPAAARRGGVKEGDATAAPPEAGPPSFCVDVAGRYARCSTELSAQLGALRSWLDQYAGTAIPGDAAAGSDARAGGARLEAGPDGHARLCSRAGSPLSLEADAHCGAGFVCAPLHPTHLARLGAYRTQLADSALEPADAGVCASTGGVAWPLAVPSPSPAGAPGASAKGAPPAASPPSPVPPPIAYFPLANYSITSWPVPEYSAWNLSGTAQTAWVGDATFGAALECSTASDAGVVISHVPWGAGGAWALNLWVKQSPAAPRDAEFQYLLSARNPDAPTLDDTTIFFPDQVHVFLPSPGHPAAGTVRTIVKDVSDVYAGRASRSFLDSDGAVGSNAARSTPRVDFRDGAWHMVTLTTHPGGGKGYELYVDGARRGAVGPGDTPGGFFAVGGGAPLNLGSDIVLCGRSDAATSRFFDGRVAQLSLFDAALGPEGVEALYRAVTGKAPPRAGSSAGVGAADEATRLAADAARRADAADAAKAAGPPRAEEEKGGGGGGGTDGIGEAWRAEGGAAAKAGKEGGGGDGDGPAGIGSAWRKEAGTPAAEAGRAAAKAPLARRPVPLGAAVVAGLAAVAVTAIVVGVAVAAVARRRGGPSGLSRKWTREVLDGGDTSPAAPGVPGMQMSGAGGGGAGGSGGGGDKFGGGGGGTELRVTAA